MEKISIHKSYNYISAFLSFNCTLNCPYCINFAGDFRGRKEISGRDWIKGLSRIKTTKDLPITFSGGEPTMHKDFYFIVNELHEYGKHMDLLTNGMFNIVEFMANIAPSIFNRNAPYASIRFSLHANTDEDELFDKVNLLKTRGYEVGIWAVDHPDMKERIAKFSDRCFLADIDFRVKEYLDENSKCYKYPEYMTGKIDKCTCKPSELLIDPKGNIFRCHRDLYADKNHYAHILDEQVNLRHDFSYCKDPKCSPCDVKEKFDRFQRLGHCAVEIKPIKE